jgi:hypothetical protein
MSKHNDISADHLTWLVLNRSRNQASALELFLLVKDKEGTIEKEFDFIDVTQGLTAVNFSLWRAVFLADLEDKIDTTLVDARSFLENLILHNSVAYTQDRSTREWTFFYYVNNARYRLNDLSKKRKGLLPKGYIARGAQSNGSKDYWIFHQKAFELALKNFRASLP